MKKLLLLLFLSPVIGYCQSEYSDGYKQGYCSGCNKAKGLSENNPCMTIRFKAGVGGYKQGYSDGYYDALNECRPNTSINNNQRSKTNGSTYNRSYNQAKSGIDAFNSSFDNVVSRSSTSSSSNSLASNYNHLVDKYNALLEAYNETQASNERLYNLGIARDKELMGVIESIKANNSLIFKKLVGGCNSQLEANNKLIKHENLSQREKKIFDTFNYVLNKVKKVSEEQIEALSN